MNKTLWGVRRSLTQSLQLLLRPSSPAMDFRRGALRHELICALCVFVVGLLITLVGTLYARSSATAAVQYERDFSANEIRNNIEARLNACAQILRSCVALFDATGAVDRTQWRSFVEGLQLEKHLPGVQGVGFAQWLPREQLARHIQEVRNEGFPEYKVSPEGERENYTPIVYLEPFRDRNLRAFGYDMYSEATRRMAMDRARDEATIALSGIVRLVQETDKEVQAGTLMYAPVYRPGHPVETVEERRAALVGWVYSPFRMNDLMDGTLQGWAVKNRNRQIGLQVYDGEQLSAETLLYSSQPAGEGAAARTGQVSWQTILDIAGRRWTLRFTHSQAPLVYAEYHATWLVLGGGIIISLLLSWLLLVLLNTRTRARSIAEQLTEKLRESEQSYRNQFAMNSAIMLLISPEDGRIIDANRAALRFYGYPQEALIGMSITNINTLPLSDVQRSMDSVKESEGKEFQFQHRIADGSIRDVAVSSSLIPFGAGHVLISTIQDVSDQKKAEASLNRALRRYHTLLETASDGIHVLNANGDLVEASHSFYRMLGYAPQAPELRHISDWESGLKPGECPWVIADWLNTSQCLESRHRCSDGDLIDVEINMRVVELDGKPYFCASSRDITERKRMLDNLGKLSKAVEQSPVSIVITSLSGDIEYVNPKFTEVTGYTSQEALGQNPRVLKSGDKSSDDYRELWESITAGQEWRGEFCNRKKSGEVYWERALIAPIRDSANEITHFLAIKEDITASKRTEMALRESEARLRSITDAARDAILMITPDGTVSFWNPAAERILGYSSAEAIGRNLQSLIAPRLYRSGLHLVLPAVMNEGQGTPAGKVLDLEVRHKDGTAIPVQLSLSGIQIEGQWHAVGLLRDITEQKRAEEALVLTNRNLEAATARANELAIRAESANAAKSEFLANMSHEIRTPMNGVIGMIGLLMDTELDAEQRRYAEIVRTSGESLLSLLNDILDFSKIEAGRLDMERLDFDLQSLLDDFSASLATRAHEKKLELICAADPDVPVLLRGDPGRLRQVLQNLASNALKFTESGDVVIRVALEEDREDSVMLRFSVRDSGIGIPEEKRGLLFDKFSQVDASTTRLYGGTGLGLAISRQLAELMGGAIGVDSITGVGSTFWFTAQFDKQPPSASMQSPPNPPELSGVRALIVDDNETSREILTTRLTSWGMRPVAESSGKGAIETLIRGVDEKDPFRIAVLDMQMPEIDGAALGRMIRSNAHLADTRMILLTSLGARGDARRFQEIGFSGYTTKPVQHQELRAVLALVLSNDGGDGAASRPIATRHTAREAAQPFQGRKARILIAEDNITNQRVALGILKRLGLSADAVANGEEAVRALETLPYDVVLMDVQMPEMDGLTATRTIRDPQSGVANHQIPIIAMTAHALQGDRETCLSAGMNDYVTKPISPQALSAALEKWLPADTAVRPALARPHAAQSPRSDVPVFDRKGMMDRLMDDVEIATSVASCFLEDMPRQIEALQGALDSGDLPGIQRQAHTVKGAALNIGGMALCAVATDLEKVDALDTARQLLNTLAIEFDRLKDALNRELPPQ